MDATMRREMTGRGSVAKQGEMNEGESQDGRSVGRKGSEE